MLRLRNLWVLVGLIGWIGALEASAKSVGSGTIAGPLGAFVNDLDAWEIDVRSGKGPVPPKNRPQLTELKDFSGDATIAGNGDPFAVGFNAGIGSDRAFLVAVTPFPRRRMNLEVGDDRSFKLLWAGVAKEKRIFVSFSGKDLGSAVLVKSVLTVKGYFVFLYKDGMREIPPANAVEVGKYFREAGHHYVIDSENARQSAAVNAEALALSRVLAISDTKTVNTIYALTSERTGRLNSPSTEAPCCQICDYVNGNLGNCREVICDAFFCAGATEAPPVKKENKISEGQTERELPEIRLRNGNPTGRPSPTEGVRVPLRAPAMN
jgi:hypothetical protein